MRAILNSLPILLGVVLLVGLLNSLIPKSFYTTLFSQNLFLDSVVGSALGSVLVGNPITSYVLAGEMLQQGVSLVAVTAFLVAWVTVGVVQFPAEAILLGRRFAVWRNVLSFFFSILVALFTVAILSFF
ncbi:hypothetical protein K9N08_04400 [Candidatus Gracilibacteria bacterium]|nr:hypothetical protein [Candidatus Gracilibacteria bacterium]MCF7856753.1 hypothetical protein [Candidatus Gracilibacteria bacterium]MCF7897041.1 hypothetical protein [Candidatus Gracilibacteria bacterium]